VGQPLPKKLYLKRKPATPFIVVDSGLKYNDDKDMYAGYYFQVVLLVQQMTKIAICLNSNWSDISQDNPLREKNRISAGKKMSRLDHWDVSLPLKFAMLWVSPLPLV